MHITYFFDRSHDPVVQIGPRFKQIDLYMIFAICAGLMGGALSGLMRWEPYEPGPQLFGEGSWLSQLEPFQGSIGSSSSSSSAG